MLVRGQLASGGWADSIEFDPELRKKHAYRVDLADTAPGKRSNLTTFDDDKSQSAARFLMQLDQELKFQDAALHEAALYALDAFVQAQYPNGAWPQRFSEPPVAAEFPVVPAAIPADWPREYGQVKYTSYYTLNDGTMRDLVSTMLAAYDVYHDERVSRRGPPRRGLLPARSASKPAAGVGSAVQPGDVPRLGAEVRAAGRHGR